jgi:hypothetical protein
MKRTVCFIVLCSIFLGGRITYAQTTTLQFSQVVTFAQTNVTASTATIGTVPAGKVWKIEHMAGYRSGGYLPAFVFYVNGVQSSDFYSYAVTSYYYPNEYPKGVIWLKAGDEIRIINSSVSYPSNYFVSIVEFSVVTNP